jgi:hypothetical protein
MRSGKYILLISIAGIIISFPGCRNESVDNKAIYEADTSKPEYETVKKAKSIFYHMYLPSEMYKVFEKAGALYNPEILNPVENVNQYESSYKAALNLGIYGVDLSYNKMFGQNQKTLLYFIVIHKLSQQLGIPDNQFETALKKVERNISDRDSLAKYATDIYITTNHFLNENDRQATAALVLTGGWIEALYIAAKIADENVSNEEIIERIAFQKYSLRSLISLLSNYQKDGNVAKYLLMLKTLKRSFDKFEIYYEPGDLKIDTINKMIRANKIDFNLQKKDVKDIKALIIAIRNDVVN